MVDFNALKVAILASSSMIMGVIIVGMIVIIALAFTCTSPFKSFLTRCVETQCLSENPLNEWNGKSCLTEDLLKNFCGQFEKIVDGKCVSICDKNTTLTTGDDGFLYCLPKRCKDDEISYAGTCIKKLCKDNEFRANTTCIINVAGNYRTVDADDSYLGIRTIETVPGNPLMFITQRDQLTVEYTGALKYILANGNTIQSVKYDDNSITWDNGDIWTRLST